jgi:copper chaperone CopZ
MASVETSEKKTWLATLGAIVTSIVASACCWLPLLLITFGFSAAGIGSFFEEYRPCFLTAAFLLLAFAWYLTYRPAIGRAWRRLSGKEVQRPAEACCAEETSSAAASSCCPPASTRRLRFNQVMLWVATAVVIAFAFFPSYAGILLGDGSSQKVAETTAPIVTLRIEGMTCEACTAHIQKTLADVPGVQSASVDYGSGTARVAVDAKAPPPREALVKAVETAGYRVSAERDKNMTAKNTNPNLISLFSVPSLVCSAAPEIGCGPRAKPILLDLQRDSSISEAWLNSAGTVLAVVGTEGSTRESRAKAIRAILQAKEGAAAAELEGDAREKQLKSFASGDGWYRGAEVDTLSKQEAGIIAARLVRRIQAKVRVPDDKAKALQLGFADAFNRCITSKPDTPQESRLQQYNEQLLKVAQANLDDKGVGVFKEALAQGYSPMSGEK